MQKFFFKLQRLLDYRKIRENQAEAEFGNATRVFLYEKERLSRLKSILGDTLDGLKHEQAKSSALLTLKMYQDYIDKTREGIQMQAVKVAAASERRQRCLKLFEEASRKRKIVDNLRDKKLQQYQEEILHEEQAFLDEVSGQRHLMDS